MQTYGTGHPMEMTQMSLADTVVDEPGPMWSTTGLL